MIYAGTDLKFKVEIEFENFTISDDDFNIVVKNKWGQTRYTVEKDEMFTDEEGNYYFTLEAVSAGIYYAILTAQINDDDYDKMKRSIVDMQHLCNVSTLGACYCHTTPMCNDCNCEHKVSYEQIWTINLDDGTYLADKNGNLIYTSDGKRIQLKKE